MIIFVLLICRFRFVPPLIYVVIGSSKHLAVGTVAACSLLIADTIGQKVPPKKDPTLYLHLVFTATFFTGIFQTALGFLRSLLITNQLLMNLLGKSIKLLLIFQVLIWFFFFHFWVKAWNFGRFFVTFHDHWFHGRHCYNNMLATTEGPVRIETFYY